MDCDQENIDNEQSKSTDVLGITSLKSAYIDDNSGLSGIVREKKLCRYYYLDHCMIAKDCSFMHAKFPCKFYYFGYECKDGKNCKLLHGRPLDPDMKEALWNHVMNGPANLLQRFPCFPQLLLEKNFNDRHNELVQLEQEGLLEMNEVGYATASVSNPISKTISKQIQEMASKPQITDEVVAEMEALVDILTSEQIASLASIGVETLEQLLQCSASSLMELGFDYDTLIKIENFKELQRKTSIYTAEANGQKQGHTGVSTTDIFGSDGLDVSLPVPVDQPALTDQELLSILNEDQSASTVSEINRSSVSNIEILSGGVGETNISSISGRSFPEVNPHLNDAYSGVCERKVDVDTEINQDIGFVDKALQSDAGTECLQLLHSPSVKEMENDKKSLDSFPGSLDQQKRIDELLPRKKRKQNTIGSINETEFSGTQTLRQSVPVTDGSTGLSENGSDGQKSIRMPFKSIINRYTPATEIDASNGQFPITPYKLIPVEIPQPNFECIRRTFVTAPTYSLDPRIQIMFNVGSTEKRHVDASKVSIRDPRLKKSPEANISDELDQPT